MSQTPKRSAGPAPALSSQDWVRAALRLIAREGVAAVAVEPLARELGVTKGSFYWHFANRDALIQAALGAWEADQGRDVVARYEGIADSRKRLRVIMFAAFEDQENGRLFAALSASSEDPRVNPYLARASEQRLALGIRSLTALGLPEEEARRKALALYAAYAGYFQLQRAMPGAVARVTDLSAFVRDLVDALLPDDPAPEPSTPPA